MKPLILNIETATDICSVCIAKGEQILAIQESSNAYSHASAITLLIEACAKDADITLKALDAVAVSSGPGSYTALRVGASVAKGICYALNKPLIAVDTLEALAFAVKKEKPEGAFFIPMIDARRMEVYASVFDTNMNRVLNTQNVILDQQSFSDYFEQGTPLVFCGNGAAKTQELFDPKQTYYSQIVCAAKHLVALSNKAFQNQKFSDIAYYSPEYYKAPNITKPKKIL